MQFSKLALLSATTSAVLAAPAIVTVTQRIQQQATVTIRATEYVQDGQTLTSYITDGIAHPTDVVADVNVEAAAATTTTPEQQVATAAAPTTTTTPTTTAAAATATTTPTTAAAAATTSASAASIDGLSDNNSILLATHNTKRALHKDTGSLTWSTELENYAQNYADSYDCSGTLTHSGGPYGENLALGYGIEGAVTAWYDEISDYDYSNPGFSEEAGHFTQLVWKSSTQVGCGVKTCDNAWGDYVVCSYSPAGNVIGDFDSNVMPLA